MQILDTSVTNVILPHLQGSLSAGLDEVSWVITSYLAANAVVIPATGWLVGVVGRKRFFLICTVLFVVSSFLSGAAPDLTTLIIARIFQGLGGGPIIPLSQAILWEIFPLGGFQSPGFEEMTLGGKIVDLVMHSVLPLTAYLVGSFAVVTMLMKNSLIENMSADYVRTALAKGLSWRRAVFVHALRNSLIPISVGIGGEIGLLFAGSFLIERTCNIPGMGLLGFSSLLDRDYPVLMGILVIGVLLQLVGNILSDIVLAVVDPRVRFR